MTREPVTIDDLRALARKRLPQMLFDYVEGGAESESSVRANRSAFEGVKLRPRVLVDVSTRSLDVELAGHRLELPILLSPVGLAAVVGPGAEVWAARAASEFGTVSVVSTAASTSLEGIAEAASEPQWFQLYPWGDRSAIHGLLDRARVAGYSTLVVTVDVPVTGGRERDVRNGMVIPPRPSPGNVLDLLRHPRWLARLARGPAITFANLGDENSGDVGVVSLARRHERLINPHHTWEDLRWMRDAWPGAVFVKGITNEEDASLAAALGCDGLIVSNHGGRQLDHMPATLDVLPRVAGAVDDRMAVVLDGGIRRGTDIVKALALGADAVMVGRPWLYGAAAMGESGVRRSLSILRNELDRTLMLMGAPRVDSLSTANLYDPDLHHPHDVADVDETPIRG